MPPNVKRARKTNKQLTVWPEYYQDKAGRWRWRLTAGNNEIYGASHQSFTTRGKAKANFELPAFAVILKGKP
jgi:uncharacterized protein YegP (UPF0339 family)